MRNGRGLGTSAKALGAGLTLALALAPAAATAASRVKAQVTCEPMDQELVYRCTIRLSDAKTGKRLAGAKVVVHADMPSMPMAHSVRPATATPGPEPGTYHAALHLEMHGRWALRIRVSGPVRDQIVHVEEFGPASEGSAGHGVEHGAPEARKSGN